MPDDLRTQTAQIRAHMEAGNWITRLDALAKFHCMNLPGRIFDCKALLAGTSRCVVKRTRKLSSGKRIAEYTIALREG